jgi:DNA repair protein RadD
LLELRNYQRASIDAFYSYCESSNGSPLISLPTGSGKALVLAKLCQEIITEHPTLRIICATHVRELITQDYNELLEIWPEAPCGIYSAGIGRRDKDAQILFAGVQSVWRPNRLKEIGSFDLMIVDESHLISHEEDTTYRKLIAGLRETRPNMRVLGLSATCFRLSTGRLDRGKGKLFDDIIYEANVRDLIDAGYLCKLISKATLTRLDVKGVGKKGGEFIQSELEIAVDKDWITRGAVDEVLKFGEQRKAWLIFCTGVRHATNVSAEIKKRGISCDLILGDTPKQDRDRMIVDFKTGALKCLVSVMVVATGFNAPHVDLIALLRPTQSAGLFLQQVGRGLRKAEGKSNCLVLDFAGNLMRHGPIDTITADSVTSMKARDDAPKAKECPECASLVPLGIMECPDCGYLWPVKKRDEVPKHAATADNLVDILSTGKPEWITVDEMSFATHRKRYEAGAEPAPPSLRLEYRCGLMTYTEYLALEKAGGARFWAEKKWRQLRGNMPVPSTVAEAIERIEELTAPDEILVKRQGKYFDVSERRYSIGASAATG